MIIQLLPLHDKSTEDDDEVLRVILTAQCWTEVQAV